MCQVKAHQSWLVVLVAASVLAQSTPPGSLESCTDEDYAIYAAALTDLYGNQKFERVVVIDQTSMGFPPGMAAMTQFGGKAQPLLKDFSKAARDDFDARNKVHAKIEAEKVRTPFEIVLLSTEEAHKLVAGKSGWELFQNKYAKSPGITLVSRPGIDLENGSALLYVGNSCGMLCGDGNLIFLVKENGAWKVANKVMVWIS